MSQTKFCLVVRTYVASLDVGCRLAISEFPSCFSKTSTFLEKYSWQGFPVRVFDK